MQARWRAGHCLIVMTRRQPGTLCTGYYSMSDLQTCRGNVLCRIPPGLPGAWPGDTEPVMAPASIFQLYVQLPP